MEKIQYINAEHVKTLMKEKNITDKTLALSTGFSLPFIKRFLSGADQKHYSSIVIFRLAKALDVSANSLLHKEFQKN